MSVYHVTIPDQGLINISIFWKTLSIWLRLSLVTDALLRFNSRFNSFHCARGAQVFAGKQYYLNPGLNDGDYWYAIQSRNHWIPDVHLKWCRFSLTTELLFCTVKMSPLHQRHNWKNNHKWTTIVDRPPCIFTMIIGNPLKKMELNRENEWERGVKDRKWMPCKPWPTTP